jgi:phospholipid/cholesterol/gamma-HCH transport system substrate-binding protein
MERRFKFRHVNEITGTFVLIILALVIAAVVLTGRSQRWFTPRTTLYVALPETGASGLRPGAEVYVLGTFVGTVNDIVVEETGQMKARIKIRKDFFRFLRDDSVAILTKKLGIAGDTFLDISRGTGGPLPARDAVIMAETPPNLMEKTWDIIREDAAPLLKKTSVVLEEWRKVATDLGPVEERVQQLVARFDDIVARIQQGKGTAGRLLTDPAIADELEELLLKTNASLDELKIILDNVQQASTNLPDITESVQQGLANLPAVSVSIKQTTQDLPALIAQTQETLHEIQRLVGGMQRHWLLRKYVRQADKDKRKETDSDAETHTSEE